MVINSKRFWW